jgi:hypothetical protein
MPQKPVRPAKIKPQPIKIINAINIDATRYDKMIPSVKRLSGCAKWPSGMIPSSKIVGSRINGIAVCDLRQPKDDDHLRLLH